MNRIEIKGAVNTAICYAKVVEKEALEQIQRMCYLSGEFLDDYLHDIELCQDFADETVRLWLKLY